MVVRAIPLVVRVARPAVVSLAMMAVLGRWLKEDHAGGVTRKAQRAPAAQFGRLALRPLTRRKHGVVGSIGQGAVATGVFGTRVHMGERGSGKDSLPRGSLVAFTQPLGPPELGGAQGVPAPAKQQSSGEKKSDLEPGWKHDIQRTKLGPTLQHPCRLRSRA